MIYPDVVFKNVCLFNMNLANVCLFKVNIYEKVWNILTINNKGTRTYHGRRSNVFIFNLEHLILVVQLLTLDR